MPRRMIRDIIAARPLITATQEMTVRAACRLMAENKIGALLIIKGAAITGIFTERDVLNKVVAPSLDPDSTPLSQVMVANPLTIRAGKPLAHALQMMAEGGFRHVPVVDDDGVPVGMVSARDALGQDMVDLENDLKRMEMLENSIGY
ncbi:cyclic nucleotide-binding/CBS domain-containing protein [Azonexus sp.]|uniref:CBS domain-containing protein n=1 Tax=Azonexus sp. TaxID=1872668 RepID=UPI0027B9DA10|nr:CBS domain-containing protein [Azonexus sp.]